MAKPTQKQLSAMTGVSQSIISKVLRGQIPRNMSKDKIKAIHEAAEKIGYSAPSAPSKPASKPKFGATPQGAPLHKYGKQWKQRVAQVTGLMPSGNFSDLKYTEQKQVMTILNSIDKDGKKRTKLAKEDNKMNKARRSVWRGVAMGAGVVGVPLSIAGLMNKLTNLIDETATTARQGATLGINRDKLVAMARKAQVYGVSGGDFTSSLRSIQTIMTNMAMGVSDEMMETLKKYATGADIGRLQSIALKGNTIEFIKELFREFQAGKISRAGIIEALSRSGAGGLVSLFTNQNLMSVLSAKPIVGAADAAIELDQSLTILKEKFEDIFIKNFPAINDSLDKFSDWLDGANFENLTSLFNDLASAMGYVLDAVGFKTTQTLLKERASVQQSILKLEQSSIKDPRRIRANRSAISSYKSDLLDIDETLKGRGVNPNNYNNSAKSNADGANAPKSQTVVHRHEIAISADTQGTLSPEQFEKMENDVKNIISRYMKGESIKISERWQ